jgi:hypothetical protein
MNTQKALLALSTNLNTDIQLKSLSLTSLKSSLNQLTSQSVTQKSLEPWISQQRNYCLPTLNMLKFAVDEGENPSFNEKWEFLFSVGDQQRPTEVYRKILGAMGEIIHLVVYRLWKIRNITVAKYSPKISQIVDALQKDWHEDTSLFLYKREENNKISKQSQVKVDFFLRKL